MSDDIVTRLLRCFKEKCGDFNDLMEAANEIERLRAELQSYHDEDEEIRRGRSGG